MKKFPSKQERQIKGQRFSSIDAHMQRVYLKDKYPEHPTLTAWALSILYPKNVKK